MEPLDEFDDPELGVALEVDVAQELPPWPELLALEICQHRPRAQRDIIHDRQPAPLTPAPESVDETIGHRGMTATKPLVLPDLTAAEAKALGRKAQAETGAGQSRLARSPRHSSCRVQRSPWRLTQAGK